MVDVAGVDWDGEELFCHASEFVGPVDGHAEHGTCVFHVAFRVFGVACGEDSLRVFEAEHDGVVADGTDVGVGVSDGPDAVVAAGDDEVPLDFVVDSVGVDDEGAEVEGHEEAFAAEENSGGVDDCVAFAGSDDFEGAFCDFAVLFDDVAGADGGEFVEAAVVVLTDGGPAVGEEDGGAVGVADEVSVVVDCGESHELDFVVGLCGDEHLVDGLEAVEWCAEVVPWVAAVDVVCEAGGSVVVDFDFVAHVQNFPEMSRQTSAVLRPSCAARRSMSSAMYFIWALVSAASMNSFLWNAKKRSRLLMMPSRRNTSCWYGSTSLTEATSSSILSLRRRSWSRYESRAVR